MEKARSRCKKIISVILSLVMVLSTIPVGRRVVFAAESKYIYEYDGETATSAPDGFTLMTSKQMGKVGALQFSKSGTDTVLWDGDAITSGTAVFELEMLPAGSCQELVKFYNSKNELLLEINHKVSKLVITDNNGGEGKAIAQTADLTESGSNTWLRLKVEFFLDEVVTNDAGNRVMQYKISAIQSPTKNTYSEIYEGWVAAGSVVTQDGMIGKNKGWDNGIVDQSIDGSKDHPFDIKTIKARSNSKARWIGDMRLYNITSVDLYTEPGTQLVGSEFSADGIVLAVNYSTGATEYIDLSSLTAGSDYTVENFDSSQATASGQAITIGYMGKDILTTVDIKELASIEVTAPSQKYVAKGAALDTSDMVVTAVFTDNSTAELSSSEYTLELDTSKTGKATATVTSKADSSKKDTFDVIVTIPEYTGDINTILDYSSDITDVNELGMTLSDGAVLETDTTNIAGHTEQKLKLTTGSMTKDWGYDITSGVVKIVNEFNRNSKNAFYRVLDKDGNALIAVGQFGNTNLYADNITVETTGNASVYETFMSGSGDSWIRLETEIDLDASNESGRLEFVMKAYSKASYDGIWAHKATITPENYTNTFGEGYSCATKDLTSFSVGSVEYETRVTKTGVAYFDNLYIGATQAIVLTGAEVKTAPTNTEYRPGATELDLTGLVLTESYSDLSTKDVSDIETIKTNYDITGFDTAVAGTKTITLTNKSDNTITASFDITVKDVSLTSIAVKTAPDKTDYLTGDVLDLTGLVIEGTYSDSSVVTLTDEEYTVAIPELTEGGKLDITVTAVADATLTAKFEINVKALNDILVYDNGEDVGALGLTANEGASASVAVSNVAGNATQQLKVTAGGVKKELGYEVTSGIVKIVTELNRNGKSAFVTIRDTEGNALINIGQFSRTNLYGVLDSAYTTSGLPFEILVDGSKERWIRLETEIDLDASNSTGVLQFTTKVYTKASYTDDWGTPTVITGEKYQGETFGNANGCATGTLTSFSVGSVEYGTQSSNTAGAYFDELYIGATQKAGEVITLTGVSVKTAPDTTEYVPGTAELDLTGLVLTETYSDESTKDVTDLDIIAASYDITGFDATEEGTKIITITNKNNSEVTTSFEVAVKYPSIVSMVIKNAPAKAEYVVGETAVDTTGLVIEATYSDNSVKTLTANDYIVGSVDLTTEGTKEVIVTAVKKDAAGNDVTVKFEINVTGLKELFKYDSTVDAIEDLNLTISGQASLDSTAIKGHDAQKLKVTAGAVSKSWGYGITTGVVKFETEFNRNGKSAFFTVRDTEGNALITIGQFSRTNLYGVLDSAYNTSGLPFEILIDGSKDNWIRLETEIDLDASNSTGVLQFTTKIYTKASYADAWSEPVTITGEKYKGETFGNANGCATGTLTSFNVASVEYATQSSNTAGAYFDNLYAGASNALSNADVKTLPAKTEYVIGATELDLTGLVLTETFVVPTRDIDLDTIKENYNISGFDTSTTGTKTITLTNKYDANIAATFDILVKNVTITSIAVTTNPAKTQYFVGDTEVDVTGMIVTGTYSDESQLVLSDTDYVVGELDSTAAGTVQITVTSVAKNEAGEAVSTTFEVTVKEPVVTGIAVTANPTKTLYVIGDEADWSGMVVSAVYDNGSTKELALPELSITGFDSSAASDSQTITIAYGNFTTTIVIKIADPANYEATEYNFDFNIDGSSTTEGWIGIDVNKSKGTKYSFADYGYTVEKGYGIAASNDPVANLQGRKESVLANPAYALIPETVYYDFVLLANADQTSKTGTFNVDLPNGTYNVQIIVGSTNANTTSVIIEGNNAYTGSATISKNDVKMFKVIEIPNVVVADGQMNITTTADTIARTNGIIISNVAAPTGVSAVLDTTDGIGVTVSWGMSLGATGYNVYRTLNGTTELVGTVEGLTNTTFKDTDVDCLETYTYFVRGISAKGLETIASNEASVEIKDSSVTAPATPADFKISAMDASATTLSWTATENASYYEVYSIAKTAADVNSISGYTLVGKTTETSYVCDMAGHDEMFFKIIAVGLGGKSAATEIAFSAAAAPLAPANLKVSEMTDETTKLTWDASENAVYYEVYWSDRNRDDLTGVEGYELIGKADTNSFVYELPTHVVRYFKVIAVGAGGKSEATECVKADIVKQFDVQAEYLDRGLVAIAVDGGVYVAWRLLGDEYAANASYNLYRDGAIIRTFDATENTSFLDTTGTAASKYSVSAVIDGTEDEKCEEVAVQSTDYLEVPIEAPEAYYDDKLTKEHVKANYYEGTMFSSNKQASGWYESETVLTDEEIANGEYRYSANDTYVGDVDGDGVYEIIVKWNGVSCDNSQHGYTAPVYIDCYKLDGTRLWRINLGINIRAGAHYTQPVVADLDGDGKAEVMMRTADGSVDGLGNVIGDASADYRNEKGHIITGPDFLTLFDGETGEALDTINYVPQRGNASDWGDNYGGRSERFLSGAAYLDGEHISAIFARGYYNRGCVAAFDVVDDKIVTRWVCDSKDSENAGLYGEGAHSFTVADVDGDGCQEIIYGAATIDHDGKLLYSLSELHGSGYGGHGDAERVTDMNLKDPGLEVFMVHEEKTKDGMELHDAATGEYIYLEDSNGTDVGRGVAADIHPEYEGYEIWSSLGNLVASDGTYIGNAPSSKNQMAWFNGDMGREFVDNSERTPYIGTYNYETGKQNNTLLEGCRTNNTSKANAAFQADMFGDWREEVAFRTSDNTAIRIYTSTETMDYRLYTLMHDPTYRAQMACNGSAYNQSPDAGFYIGYDTDLMVVPVPTLNVVKAIAAEDVKVASIVVTSPDKVTYLVGEELDLTGMVVTAVYNNNKKEVLTEGYTVDTTKFDSSAAADGIVITVTYGEFSDSFTVKVVNLEDSQSFYYIDADSIDDLGLTVKDGGSVKVVEGDVDYNTTNKLEISSGTVTKTLDKAVTTGKVSLEHVGYHNGNVFSIRILDKDGNALINIAQQKKGNYNLYEDLLTGGTPFQTIFGQDTAKNKWIKAVTVIDLDESNETGVLHFTMNLYYKDNYTDADWKSAGVFTQDNTYISAEAFNHKNGAATESLTSFSVGAVEFQSSSTSYVDDIFFDDGTGIHNIVTSQKTLKSVEITKPAVLTEYTVGSQLNTAGLEITGTYEVTYSDGRTPETKTSVITKYETKYDFSEVTDNAVVTITITDGENVFTLNYSVKVVPKGDGSYVTFEYVDDDTTAFIGFTGSNIKVTSGEVSADDASNLTNKVTLGKGTATKVFDTPFTTGTVHYETAFMTVATSSASLFLRMMNSEGKPMIDIAQYGSGNLNLYIDEKTSGTDGAMAGQFKGLPTKKWAKVAVDVDLDATKAAGHLVFDAVVWTTDDFESGNWTKFAEFDETIYLNSTMAPTTTGSASSTATVFDIASIELYNAAGSANYYDNMFFEAMGEGVSKVLTKLEITSEATKKSYVEGDNFNASGLEIMGTYEYTFKDGSTATKQAEVTNYNVEFNSRTIGDAVPVVISVGDKSVSFTVKVTKSTALEGIEKYIVDYINNELVTLLEDNTISLNKRQIKLPYSNVDGITLGWTAVSSNVAVSDRIMVVTPSTEAETEAVITVSMVTKNADGSDVTIKKDITFKVAKASSSSEPTISVETSEDIEAALEIMMELGLFEGQERLDSVSAIMSELDGNIKVEEFVAILVNLFDVDKTYTETEINRDDIDYAAWYADYVIAAFQLSVETEDSRLGKKRFGIGDDLTEEDIIYMLQRMIALDKTTLPSDYKEKMFE